MLILSSKSEKNLGFQVKALKIGPNHALVALDARQERLGALGEHLVYACPNNENLFLKLAGLSPFGEPHAHFLIAVLFRAA